MADLLDRMSVTSAQRAADARAREDEATLRRRAAERTPAPRLKLDGPGFDVIAEIKRRAPSSGRLADRGESGDVVTRAESYAAAGAAAISVLTEPDEFDGSLDDLQAVCDAVRVPVMRKDFLVDPYQMFEARAAGAAGALVIVRMLDDRRLAEMLEAASEAWLFVLLEAFDAEDLERAAAVARRHTLIGLNSRDLATLAVDEGRFEELGSRFPAGRPRVAESGLANEDDVRRVAALGYRAALIGSALMRTPEPEVLLSGMIRAGREEAARSCA